MCASLCSVDVLESIYKLQFHKSNYTTRIHCKSLFVISLYNWFWMLNTRIHMFLMLGDPYVCKGVLLCCFLLIYFMKRFHLCWWKVWIPLDSSDVCGPYSPFFIPKPLIILRCTSPSLVLETFPWVLTWNELSPNITISLISHWLVYSLCLDFPFFSYF